MATSDPITSFTGKYRFLSNFYPSPIVFRGRIYVTVEHAYQAAKAQSEIDRARIAAAATPALAKKMGRKVDVVSGWEGIKVDIMRECLEAKFQDPELLHWLIETHPSELIEGNTWGDEYWGVCRGKGKNKLGKLLMEIRERHVQKR